MDSGSGRSIIGIDYYRDVMKGDLKAVKVTSPDDRVKVANDEYVDILGNVEVELELGQKKGKVEFGIMNAGRDIIVGTNILYYWKAVIDVHGEVIRFGDGSIHPIYITEKIQRKNRIDEVNLISEKTMIVPPRSVKYLKLNVGPVGDKRDYIIKSNLFKDRKLTIRAGLVTPNSKGVVVIPVVNYNKSAVYIKKSSTVAKIEPVEVIDQSELEKEDRYKEIENQIKTMNMSEDTDLTESQIQEIRNLLLSQKDVFARNPKRPERTTRVKHKINTGDHPPIKQRSYRQSPTEQEIIEKEVREMLANGVIRLSKSPWSSPVVLVKKKDGTIRFCVDFRKLNEITKKDVYPLPRIDETLNKLKGMKYFTALDLASGYWQVEIDEEDKEKTAFITAIGLFEFNVMPFGLCNAPATFQRMMDEVFQDMDWKAGEDYIDDIIIASENLEEHKQDISKVFQKLKSFGLSVKLSKCKFAKTKLVYLGHLVSQMGIQPDLEKTKVIDTLNPPKDLKGLRRFLGLVGYYRRFINKFSKIAYPLNQLLQKGKIYNWNNECQVAFETLKRKLVEAPILAFPDFSKEMILYTDASTLGVGAILSQNIDGKERVISYASRSINKHERNYSPTELECLAVVWAVNYFRHYIYGRKFTIVTDHSALKYLMEIKSPSGRLARWALKLQEYEMEIKHRAGRVHNNVDALSRIEDNVIKMMKGPEIEDELSHLTSDIAQSWIKKMKNFEYELKPRESIKVIDDREKEERNKQLRIQQLADPYLKMLIDYLEHKVVPEDERKAREVIAESASCEMIQDVLVRMVTIGTDERKYARIMIPFKMRTKILEEFHDSLVGGHLGVKKTYEKISSRYYWRGMFKDVKSWVRACLDCSMRKGNTNKKMGLYNSLVVNRPLEVMGIDIEGPLPKTKEGFKYILVCTDLFTKWVDTIPLKRVDAVEVAKALVEKVFCIGRIPEKILSDRGPQFINSTMEEVKKLWKVSQLTTAPYHQQANGQTERFNRTLLSMLSMYVAAHQRDWDEYLPYVTFAYNTSIHESTGKSPFEAVNARKPRLPNEMTVELDQYLTLEEYQNEYVKSISRIQQEIRDYQNKMKQKRDE